MSPPFSRRSVAMTFCFSSAARNVSCNRFVRTFPRQTFDLVVGNQIHLRVQALGQLRQRFGLVSPSFTPAIKMYSNVIIRPFFCW